MNTPYKMAGSYHYGKQPTKKMHNDPKAGSAAVKNFGYAAKQAKEAGKKEFDYAGKTFPVKKRGCKSKYR